MSVLIAIPARYASTRYPGKPLVALRGPDGEKTLIRRSWEAAMAVRGADRVVVATDDARIADHARSFGAEVAMTSAACRNGTERVAEVAAALPGHDIVVNLQGDAPLTLFDIGASMAVFLRRHAPPDAAPAALDRLRADQRARLVRMMVAGLIEPRDVGRLMATLQQGIAEGQGRRLPDLAPRPGCRRDLHPLPGTGPRPVQVFRGRGSLARAAEARARGAIVTVERRGPPWRRPRVRFGDDGLWQATAGRWRDLPELPPARRCGTIPPESAV